MPPPQHTLFPFGFVEPLGAAASRLACGCVYLTLPQNQGPGGRKKGAQNQPNSRMEKGGKWGWGCVSPRGGSDPDPELCIGQTASMSHLILKTTPQSVIITVLPMKPFQGSERGCDLPKVTQLEEPSLTVGFTCLQILCPSRSLHCGSPG